MKNIPIGRIESTEAEKAILKDLEQKFPERYTHYYEIIRAHPEFQKSLDTRSLTDDELLHVLFCELLTDLEIIFAKSKANDRAGALQLLRSLKRQFEMLERVLGRHVKLSEY